jgi:hypothetical protein
MPRDTIAYHEYNQSSMLLPDYCSEEEWDDNDSSSSTKMCSSSRSWGYYRGSFGSVDSGLKRHGDTVSSSTVLTWKFYSQDGLRLEEHAIRWRIVQRCQQTRNEVEQPSSVLVESTVLCTKGIRPATSYSNKKRSNKDATMFIIYSGTEPANAGDSETLVDFDWEAVMENGAPAVQFELIAYKTRSPMFRQYDFLINGTSFFNLAEYSGEQLYAVLERKGSSSSPQINRRGAAISKFNKKLFPSKHNKKKFKESRQIKTINPRNLTRSLSPVRRAFVVGAVKSFHRRGSSMITSGVSVKENNTFSKLICAATKDTHKVSFDDIDQVLRDSNFFLKDEKTIEADALCLAYAFTSQKLHSLQSPKSIASRLEFVRKILSEMITLVVSGKLHADVASRIVHCVATVSVVSMGVHK